MSSVPSKQEVDKLYREMIAASTEVADLDQDVQDFHSRGSGLGPLVRGWTDAASALSRTLARYEAALQNAGTPRRVIASIQKRLEDLEDSSRTLDLHGELDDCVDSWNSLSQDLSKLEGSAGKELRALLEARQSQIDDITSKLSFARKNGGMAPDVYARWRRLVAARDAARERYETLRTRYLEAAFRLRQWEWEQSIKHDRDNDRAYDGSYLVQSPVGPLRISAPRPPLQAPRAPSLPGLPAGRGAASTVVKLPDAKKLAAALGPRKSPLLTHQPGAPLHRQPKPLQQALAKQPPPPTRAPTTTLHKPSPALHHAPPAVHKLAPHHRWGTLHARKPAEHRPTRIFSPPPRPEHRPRHEHPAQPHKPAPERKPGRPLHTPAKPEPRPLRIHAATPRPEHRPKHEVHKHASEAHKPAPGQPSVWKPGHTPLRIHKPAPRPEHKPAHEASHRDEPEHETPAAAVRPKHLAAPHHPQRSLAPRVAVEKLDRVVPWPEGLDGIGRGNQSAHAYFTAQGIVGALSVSGTATIALACGVKMHVAPSLHLLSDAPGGVMHGKLSLSIASPGGRLGPVQPGTAAQQSRSAARAAAPSVAAKLGKFGPGLQSAISELVSDAAEKLFSQTHPGPRPHHQRGDVHAPAHHARHGHAHHHGHAQKHHHGLDLHFKDLGRLLTEARSHGHQGHHRRGHGLHHLVEKQHARDGVAQRLAKTMRGLAHEAHALTHAAAGQMRGQIARMDAIMARLRGKRGKELIEGAQEIGHALSELGLAASSEQGARHAHHFRKLLHERKSDLARIASSASAAVGNHAVALRVPGGLAQPRHGGPDASLELLRKLHPGLDKLLRKSSHEQLGHDLGHGKQHHRGLPHGPHKHSGGKLPHAQGRGAPLGGVGGLHGGGHLGGFGGGHAAAHGGGALGALQGKGVLQFLVKKLEAEIAQTPQHELGGLLKKIQAGEHGAVRAIAQIAEHQERRSAPHRHVKPPPAQLRAGKKGYRKHGHHKVTAAALQEAFKEHGNGTFARHVAPGGKLYAVVEAAQRSLGKGIGALANQHLNLGGHGHLSAAMQTVEHLKKQGHQPHRSLWGDVASRVRSTVQKATTAVSGSVNALTSFARSSGSTVGAGISSFAGGAFNAAKSSASDRFDAARSAYGGIESAVSSGVGIAKNAFKYTPLGMGMHVMGKVLNKAGGLGGIWNGLEKGAGLAWHAATAPYSAAFHAATSLGRTVGNWAGQAAGRAWERAKDVGGHAWDKAARVGSHAWDYAKNKVQGGLEWVNKTGVVGAVGGYLKKGVSMLKTAAEYTPLGMMAKAGYKLWKSGPVQKLWGKVKDLGGTAWGGIKAGYKVASHFLQSPAGQLLTTGLSLAASFVPGGLLVKAAIGAGIGALTALSEGKDWKGVLLSAGSGAISGALPFVKAGPLIKLAMGGAQGAIGAAMEGKGIKGILAGAGGGALDQFEPKMLKGVLNTRYLKTAGKVFKGGAMGQAEKLVLGGKMGGPLRALEKVMANPKVRRTIGGLEKVGGKTVKGGIWVSGKAGKVQGVLDKVVGLGDKLDGALQQLRDNAPAIAGWVGDNAVGQLISRAGDYAGQGEEKLHAALEYGHKATDTLGTYRGYLDKGLGFAGVRDPAKAYGKMMARKGARGGNKSDLEMLAHFGERRPRGPRAHGEAGHEQHARGPGAEVPHTQRKPRDRTRPGLSRLEQAIARGKRMYKKGVKVAQSAHDKLGKAHEVLEKGLAGAEKVQGALEKAQELAKQGAGYFGEDSELGAFLTHASERAEQVHGYLETGISFSEGLNDKIGKAHDGLEHVRGVHGDDESGEGDEHGRAKKRRRKGGGSAREHATTMELVTHDAPGGKKRGGPHADPGAQARGEGEGAAKTAGRKLDHGLGHVEKLLKKGFKAGNKIDHGLRHAADLANKLGDALGDDSPLGHLAHQAGHLGDEAHLKLHKAMGIVRQGQKGLHKGRELLEKALGQHLDKKEKEHHQKHGGHGHPREPGAHGGHEHAHGGHPHHGGHGHQGGHPRGAHPHHAHLPHAHHPHGHDGAGELPEPQHGAGEQREDPGAPLHEAEQAVHAFAQAAGKGIPQIEQHMNAGDTKGAAARVQAISAKSEEARTALTRAMAATHGLAKLHEHAATLRKHYLEIRAHFFQFVSTLHGLSGELGGGLDPRKHPDVIAALGEVERAHHQRRRRQRGQRHGHHKHHDLVDEMLNGIDDGRVFVDRGANRGERDQHDGQEIDPAALDTWIGSGEGEKLFSEVFGVFLPAEGAAKGGAHHRHRRSHGSRGRGGAGALFHGDLAGGFAGLEGFEDAFGMLGGLTGHGHGAVKGGKRRRGRKGRRGARVPGGPGGHGFFGNLFHKLHGFADGVQHVAEQGEGFLGQGMHLLEQGMHGLNAVEHAAGKVHDFAGKAEGFLGAMHLGGLAHVAQVVGEDAAFVDGKAKALHGYAKQGDEIFGEAKHGLHAVAGFSGKAGKLLGDAEQVADRVEHGHLGAMLRLFKASRFGDGIDGKRAPERMRLGSALDEPRRLDGMMMSRMQQYLGGDFSSVRIHTGPGAAEVTKRYDAEAVTVKDHIFFAPGRFNTQTAEGEKLIAHELTHVLQKNRPNLDVRTAESEALHSEHSYVAPQMETLNLGKPPPDFKLPDGEGLGAATGIHTARRTRSKGHEAGGKDEPVDGDEFIEQVSGRVYELLMEELEASFESR